MRKQQNTSKGRKKKVAERKKRKKKIHRKKKKNKQVLVLNCLKVILIGQLKEKHSLASYSNKISNRISVSDNMNPGTDGEIPETPWISHYQM